MKLDQLTSESWEFIIDHTEKLPQGIHLWYKGVPYPRRVYYDKANDPNFTLRAIEALGTVKKFLFSLTYLPKLVIPRTLNFKKYETFLISLEVTRRWQLAQYLLKDDEWSVPVWEMGKFVKVFLVNLGLNEDLAFRWARIIMCFLEFDNAYRYRLQDLMGIGFKGYSPFKLIKVILKVYKHREGLWGAWERLEKLMSLRYLLLFPRFKRAFAKAWEAVDVEKVKLDINDRYHVSWWRGYDYFGLDWDTRYQFFLKTHKGNFPPFRKREDPELTARFLLGV